MRRRILIRDLPETLPRLGDAVLPQLHREVIRDAAGQTLDTVRDLSPVGGKASRRRWGRVGTYKASHGVALGAPNLDRPEGKEALQGVDLDVPTFVGSAAQFQAQFESDVAADPWSRAVADPITELVSRRDLDSLRRRHPSTSTSSATTFNSPSSTSSKTMA